MANTSGLSELLSRYDIPVSAAQTEALADYHQMLLQWNQRMNLTRHIELETFVVRDVWDSFQLAKVLGPGTRILDVGTGGGVPGVLLAILRPDLEVALCESVGKKAEAVADIVVQLGSNTTVYAGRGEHVVQQVSFDSLVARAVGPLWRILNWFRPHWDHFGRLVLIKGPKWVEERGQARHRGLLNQLHLRRLASYQTPGHDGESVVLAIAPSEERLYDDSRLAS